MSGFLLDAGARRSLDVALETASAMGDERCGTEHLLFGVMATARGDMAELARAFALDTLRLDRSVRALRSHHCSDPGAGPPLAPGIADRLAGRFSAELAGALSDRARVTLGGPSLARHLRRSSFDLLVSMLADPRSGAATVLRHLGVRISEVRRLAELGAARLGRAEVDDLIAALDRRRGVHQPWWGPAVDAPANHISLPDGRPVEITRSCSAVATLDGLVTGPDGFGMTLSLTSRQSWLLPPVWEPREELVPGVGAEHRLEPEMVLIRVRFPDGHQVSNRLPCARWSSAVPEAALVRLGQTHAVQTRNDRRIPQRRQDTCEWWVWPIPEHGDLFVDLVWPVEAVRGSIRIDGPQLARHARRLRAVG